MRVLKRKRAGKVIETWRSDRGYKLAAHIDEDNQRKERRNSFVSCKKHPKYMAIRLPRTACYDCWYKWFVDHGFIDL